MFAIIETGGKQYQVSEGRYVDIEMLENDPDSKVIFENIIMLVNGQKSKIGQPYVKNATVEGTVVKHDKSKKVLVYKQRAKKGYRRKQGHRQNFTRVMIDKIRTSAKKSESASEEV
ncbi:MAG: 50S ribosomal protein L21 [Candidatus Gastranaerophilales bacterium]|nr:50S ribosomal protein L21 [Candidatus Gastranaerophilales bacterium]